jgi:urea transport system substrate-binding protein
MFGPSCEASARLAVAEINSSCGVLGRELRLVVIDGGQWPTRVADEVDSLISAGAIDAVIGWHISAVRQAVAPPTVGRVPYVYTALYEGGERRRVCSSPERPRTGNCGRPCAGCARSAACSRGTWWVTTTSGRMCPAAAAHSCAEALGGRICAESYVRLRAEDFGDVLRDIGCSHSCEPGGLRPGRRRRGPGCSAVAPSGRTPLTGPSSGNTFPVKDRGRASCRRTSTRAVTADHSPFTDRCRT